MACPARALLDPSSPAGSELKVEKGEGLFFLPRCMSEEDSPSYLLFQSPPSFLAPRDEGRRKKSGWVGGGWLSLFSATIHYYCFYFLFPLFSIER